MTLGFVGENYWKRLGLLGITSRERIKPLYGLRRVSRCLRSVHDELRGLLLKSLVPQEEKMESLTQSAQQLCRVPATSLNLLVRFGSELSGDS